MHIFNFLTQTWHHTKSSKPCSRRMHSATGELWLWSQPGFKSCVCYSLSAFISCGLHNTVPQMGWLNTAEISSLRAQEPGSLMSQCWQGWFLLQLRGRICPLPFYPSFSWLPATLGAARLVDRCPTPISAPISQRLVPREPVGLKSLPPFSCTGACQWWIQDDFLLRVLINFLCKGPTSK